MNILIDLLPTSVLVEGIEYRINSDFRTSMLFEIMMQDSELEDRQKILQALSLYYKDIPKAVDKAIDKILWFYSCGKKVESTKGTESVKVSQIYSFEYDDEYIYSAFLCQYGIDLQDIQYLHWWKFKALFKALKEDIELVKIMGYRAMDLSKIKDKEQKMYYRKMKEMYKIPTKMDRDEKQKLDNIENVLIGDGDLKKILLGGDNY
jgi:hypothetical protein